MEIKDFLRSKVFKQIICTIGSLIVLLIVFRAGMFVGHRRASFSYGMGDNYYKVFDKNHREGFMGMMGEDFPNAHGTAGRIIKVELPILIIEDRDGTEKTVLIKENTSIKKDKDDLKSADLKADDFAVIIGSPNNKSQIEATLIRLLPPPPGDFPFPGPGKLPPPELLPMAPAIIK
ncbi:MAG: hypothetical protein WCX95_01770 [Candidatus Gracilibacteria bacterium]